LIVVDANVIVSNAIGVQTARAMAKLFEAGVSVAVCAPQLREAHSVLTHKLRVAPAVVSVVLDTLKSRARIIDPSGYVQFEAAARARLHERAQLDWPVLAAALAYDGAIWSNDRDFFGVGVPVWSTRNVAFAAQGAS